MIEVHAKVDIVSEGGLLVARAGTSGMAERHPKPRLPLQCGKLLVTFGDRKRAYWCSANELKFFGDNVPKPSEDYVAKKIEHDQFDNALRFPKFLGVKDFHFGRNLLAFRQARKLSQAELASKMEACGLETAQSTISFRESAPNNPGGEFVRAAAEVLNIPPFAFFIDLKKPHGYRRLAKFLAGVSSSVCEE